MSSLSARARSLLQLMVKYLSELNVYVAAVEDTPADRHSQILSTRLYICLLTVSMVIVLQYTALSSQTIKIRVNNPSLNQIETLLLMHSSTLSCPCSQIAVSTDTLVTLKISFHQVSIARSLLH